MPVPLRDDGTPGPTRHLIVFVHGFVSDQETWTPLRTLLEADPEITAVFDICLFSYRTSFAHIPVTERLPTLTDLGRKFGDFLKRTLVREDGEDMFIDATLIGHSMGGLVIQSYLQQCLNSGDGLSLNRIRQVIQFATPNFGSNVATGFRRFLAPFFSNPQEEALRLFSEAGRTIHEGIRDLVIFAKERTRNAYPLPFYCFWGESDGIVGAISAQGHFPFGAPLPGNHTHVHCPSNATGDHYKAIKQALRRPHGHSNVWEIERFQFTVRVTPKPAGTEILAQYGDHERKVIYDNVAQVRRQVTFGGNNACQTPFVLKYGTNNQGWIVPQISWPHRTPPDKLRFYENTGVLAHYEVDPKPSSVATLDLTVYKGFDRSQRDFHMHLGRSSYYRRVHMEVNLKDYADAGWRISPPQLYFHPVDPDHDKELCTNRKLLDPEPVNTVQPAGTWAWDLEFVREGVIDMAWDVEPPASLQPYQTISLKPGEHAVLGYGSLLSIASLESTLGRPYSGPFCVCSLEGWRRSWDIAMPNEIFVYREGDRLVKPEKIFYLNIRRQADARMNAIIFVVRQEELDRFDQREWIYNRVAMNQDLRGVQMEGGTAWAYVAKPEYIAAHPDSAHQGAIRQTYLDILDAGHRALGVDFRAAYDASTDPVPRQLVVADLRQSELPDGV